MKQLPATLRKRLIYNRASKMAYHPELMRKLVIDIWFCDPHPRRPRGSNENINGHLAPFLGMSEKPATFGMIW